MSYDQSSSPFRQVFATDFDHFGVEIHHDDSLDRLVTQDFTGCRKLSTASNEDRFGRSAHVSDTKHRRVDEGLVVGKLVEGRALGLSVGNQSLLSSM